MAHQTSDYAGWLLRLTVEYWITIKAKPGKRGTCCSLWLSERWQVREEKWTVNSHLFCFCTFNWAFGNGIINMQLQSPRECAGEVRPCVRVCLFGVCESARMCESLLICVPWVSRGHSSPLCAEWEETRGPSRHEITDYTLNASPRGLNRAQESKIEGERGKKGGKKGESEREMMREKQTTEWMVWTAKGQEEAACTEGKQWWERVRLWERTGEMERKRKWGRDSGRMLLCFSYQAGRAILLPAALQWAVEGLVLQWWP